MTTRDPMMDYEFIGLVEKLGAVIQQHPEVKEFLPILATLRDACLMRPAKDHAKDEIVLVIKVGAPFPTINDLNRAMQLLKDMFGYNVVVIPPEIDLLASPREKVISDLEKCLKFLKEVLE